MLSSLRYIGILCILLLTGCGVQFNPSHVAKYAEKACEDHGGVFYIELGGVNKLVCKDVSVFIGNSWFPKNPYREVHKREKTK